MLTETLLPRILIVDDNYILTGYDFGAVDYLSVFSNRQ